MAGKVWNEEPLETFAIYFEEKITRTTIGAGRSIANIIRVSLRFVSHR